VSAALVGVMALRQEQEPPLCVSGVFFCRVAAKPLEALPVHCFLGLLFAFPAIGLGLGQQLHMPCDHPDARPGCLDAAAKHLPAFTPGLA
jgi:hypothetical protein